MRTGQPLPDAIQNAPELWPGMGVYYSAWVELDSCRMIGFNVGPVPWTAIEEYCIRLDLDIDEKADMHFFLRKLDGAYLDHQRKK